jgi:Ca2+-transporting ATPase
MSDAGDDAGGRAGLSTEEARRRLEAEGPNLLPSRGARPFWRIAFDALREPMLLLLLAGGGIYLLFGSPGESVILFMFASGSIVLTVVQETRTERALEALRNLSAPRALVIRDGERVRIPGAEVVRGDLLVLEQGDRVAADARVLEARELELDESLLTGESLPVRKRAAVSSDTAIVRPGGDDLPFVYSGTMVTRGGGFAETLVTGPRTEIGRIGQSLATLESVPPRLRKETARIVRVAAVGGSSVALLVVLLFGLFRGSWTEAMLAGIAIGMSLLPEEFGVVLTIFLAMGARRIARAGVLTRRIAAIETMGATTLLCTDKTGTLTQNRMTVTELWLASGESLPAGGSGAVPERFRELLDIGLLASAPVPVDPMDAAFHAAGRNLATQGRWALAHSYGLRPELLAITNVWDTGNELLVAAKGAPEAIAALCALEGDERTRFNAAVDAMAAHGMRVLGIAAAHGTRGAPADYPAGYQFRLLGLAGLSDPLREGAADAVAQCGAAGIKVVMITGDYAATARAIAAQAGITGGTVMTGAELDALDDSALASRIGEVRIFARTLPEQKLRIVEVYKAAGEIVAMTGDGVNDAPALRAAHVGVAMGGRGTDVAREAAALVLLDDDFGSIVKAIRLGRRVYDNIRKAMGFIVAVHVPIAGLALLPLLTGSMIVLGPVHIALIELIIDPVCALAFEAEHGEEGIMTRPPRSVAARLFSRPMLMWSLLQGGLALIALIALFAAGQWFGLPHPQLRGLMFFALVAAVLALIIVNRSFSTSLWRALTRGNPTLRYIVGGVVAGAIAIRAARPVRDILDFGPIDGRYMLAAAAIGIALALLLEKLKPLSSRN